MHDAKGKNTRLVKLLPEALIVESPSQYEIRKAAKLKSQP